MSENLKIGRKASKPATRPRRRRVTAYAAPPPNKLRRLLAYIFNLWTLSLTLFLVLAIGLTLTYYWFEFSDRIDSRLLSGEVFTPSAGIYSAPKMLRVGEQITAAELTEYLKSAGYIEKNARADATRSRYSTVAGRLVIEPGMTAVIDAKKVFPSVSVKFEKNGKSVAALTDLENSADVQQLWLEPKMLSTVAAEGDGRRKTITFNDVPPQLINAITVTEDRAFFEHYGVNFRGIARALWRRYESDENTPLSNQGGSSITQQLVKNLLLSNEPTLRRKITEAYMSVILETRLTKQEIFTLYVNQIYLGQQSGVSIYGVGEAANVYFGKDVSQLNLAESAFIAGIIRSPNRYNPFKNLEKVTERRNQVLESMAEAAVISPQQLADARAAKVELKQLSNRKDLQGMPYFSNYVIEELPKVVSDPEALQRNRIYTSIDPDLQRIAYEIVSKRLDKLEKFYPKKPPGSLNAALVAIRPKTGEIVAMIGGRDYLQNQFNRATDAKRQPGSVFKPFVYTAAINSPYDTASRIFTAATVLKDEKKIFTYGRETYAPNNYGDTFSNAEITLRDALVKSKNTITVDLGMQANIGKVMNLAYKAGLPKVEKAYPSMALGTSEATPLEVATAYTTFANLGDRVLPSPIRQVTSGDGRLVAEPRADRKEVVRPEVAYIMNDIMKDVINRGTAAGVQAWGFRNAPGKTAIAGKTGTSRDGWFAGFTPEIVCVVYVGFDDGSDLDMKGADSAMPIWADFMQEALRRYPEWNGDWPMPASVRKAEIDTRNGSLIRELIGPESAQAIAPSPSPTPTSTPDYVGADDPAWATPDFAPPPEAAVPDVPSEFRRVELFVGGTVPNRTMNVLAPDPLPDTYNETEIPVREPPENPDPSPTPMNDTWQQRAGPDSNFDRRRDTRQKDISIVVCTLTGMRATANCPERELRTYNPGSEPKDFCTFHR